MAIQSLTDLKALINSTIQDNTTNDISGSDVQTALINAIDTLDSAEGFINVHKANGQSTITAYGSKALARAAVPTDFHYQGIVIAYKLSTGWVIEQNLDATAGTWSDDASWVTTGPVSVSQNTSTGSTEISVGDKTLSVAQNMGAIDLGIKTYGAIILNGVWTNYPSAGTKFFPIVPNALYDIKANNSNKTYYCFVKAIPTAYSQAIQFATGYTDVYEIGVGQTATRQAPSDALFLYVVSYDDSTNYLPVSIVGKERVVDNAPTLNSDNLVKSGGVASAIANTEQGRKLNTQLIDNIEDSKSLVSGWREIKLSDCTLLSGYINENSWVNDSSVKSIVIPVEGLRTYRITIINSGVSGGILATLTPNDGVVYARGMGFNPLAVGTNYLRTPVDAKSIVYVYSTNNGATIHIQEYSKYVFEEYKGLELVPYSYNLNSLTQVTGFPITDSQGSRWINDNSVKCVVIPVKGGHSYNITTSATVNAAIFASMTPQDLDFASGESGVRVLSTGTTKVTVPNDAKCICVVYSISGTVNLSSVTTITEAFMSYSGAFTDGYLIANGGVATDEDKFKVSDRIPTFGKRKMKLTMIRVSQSSSIAGMMFYDFNGDKIDGSFNPSYTGKSSSNDWVKEMIIYVPSNACYFRTTIWSDSFAEENEIDNTVYYKFYADEDSRPITKGFVKNEFVENVIRRSRQFSNVKWLPIADISRICSLTQDYSNGYPFVEGEIALWYRDYFKKDNRYKGIPYSFGSKPASFGASGGYQGASDDFGYPYGFQIGTFVPFEAFVTAIRHHLSFLYDKATNTANLNCIPYGSDCVNMACYAMNWPYSSSAGNLFRGVGNDYTEEIGAVSSMDLTLLSPADFLVSWFHTAMITDVFYEGKILMIEVSEETSEGGASNYNDGEDGVYGGVSYRKLWSADDFRQYFGAYYTVRRLKNFAQFEITYEFNQYATIEPSLARPIMDMACLPYMGNKFVFKSGKIPSFAKKILINAKNFTSLKVYLDGTLLNTYSIDNNTEYVDIDFSTVGTYTARLYDANNKASRTCIWYVKDSL